MKTVQVPKAGGELQLVNREIPAPQADWVRIRVHACGVCHSDMMVKEGYWPGLQYPRVPGHEVAGVIDELGANAWASAGMEGIVEYVRHAGTAI